MSENRHIILRAYFVYAGFVVLMIAVIFRTISIQFEGRSNVFASSEEKMPIRKSPRYPRRGEILDINLTPLVTSVCYYNIYMDPTVVKQDIFDEKIAELSKGLARIYPEKSAREYQNMIRSARARKSRYLIIHKKASGEERDALNKLPIFDLGRLKGGIIDNEEVIVRKKPNGELMSRTLGFYRKNETEEVKVGIEGAYNQYLSGEEGEEIEQKISTGWKKTGQVVKEAVEGADIVTSIDKDIQEVAHSELLTQLKKEGARSGCVVVMEVKTGFIKAISNLTEMEDGSFREDYNYAIGHKEVPGSTFKLASLMAALEDGLIDTKDKVNAVGSYRFPGKTYTDAHGGPGWITIEQAFEKSSNVISKVITNAYRKNPLNFYERLESFGLTKRTGIALSGEPKPTVYKPGTDQWHGLSLPSMAIGYEVQQTPLQTLTFYNAVANNGTMVKPQLVYQIRRGPEVIKTFSPSVLIDQLCSEETLRKLKKCLEGVMQKGGTGARLTSSQFTIAGKTGTAKLPGKDKRYGAKGQGDFQASFVGYFPANKPIYSCIVVISAPSKNIYGAVVSGTVFAAIANKVYASNLQYHKAINETKKRKGGVPSALNGNVHDLARVYRMLKVPFAVSGEGEWMIARRGKSKAVLRSRKINKDEVPDLTGMSARDAVYMIESLGMTAHVVGFGKVNKQSVPAGRPVYRGGVIELILN